MTGLVERLFAPKAQNRAMPLGSFRGVGLPDYAPSNPQAFEHFARNAYSRNITIYAGLNILARSAAEPQLIGRRWRRERPRGLRSNAHWDPERMPQLNTRRHHHPGRESREVNRLLVWDRFIEETPNHALVQILNSPNPYRSRGMLWGTVTRDRFLAGNAFVLKGRDDLGAVRQLWRMRPDRVRIVPDRTEYCRYEYHVNGKVVEFPHADVLHFRTDELLDDYYGMPPLMAGANSIAIDNYRNTFLANFYQTGGAGAAAILNSKSTIPKEVKDEIRAGIMRRMQRAAGAFEILVLDNSENFEWKMLGLDRGLRDALPQELGRVTQAELAMLLGIPGSILGLEIGYESSSYANKRQDWQVFWDITMAPMVSEFDDVLNLGLVPEFGGIDEVLFDITKIRALQEDEEAIQERHRKNFGAGIETWEEARFGIGLDPQIPEGLVLVPSTGVLTPVERLGEMPEEPRDVTPEEPQGLGSQLASVFREVRSDRMIEGPSRGRRPLAHDPAARRLWGEARELREQHPDWGWADVAAEVGISERQLRRYREAFGG